MTPVDVIRNIINDLKDPPTTQSCQETGCGDPDPW